MASSAPHFFMVTSLALMLSAAGLQPKPTGHFLTHTELEKIHDVPCLQAKQNFVGANCSLRDKYMNRRTEGSKYHAGNFPRYTSDACNSGGELLCDPDGILSDPERRDVIQKLKALRQQSGVVCGRLQSDPVDTRHLQPFYLGLVVLPNTWPNSELGAEALQTFGQTVVADWNMSSLYVGFPQPYHRCPNAAVLIVSKKAHQAFLSSASCEFMCATRGGPEVVTAALLGLDGSGAAGGLIEGMKEAYHVVDVTASKYEVPMTTSKATSDDTTPSPFTSVTWQRIFYIIAVCGFVGSVAFGVLLLLPGMAVSRRKK